MTFQSPGFLLVLVIVPLAAAAYAMSERRARTGAAAFAAPVLVPAVAPRRPGWRRHVPLAVVALALVALAAALARPRVTVAVPVEQARIVLVADRSGSMLARDVQPSRLAAARRAAGAFLDRLPDGVRVGAIAFNQVPQALQSPTRDRGAVRRALEQVDAAGSTATGEALRLALRMARSGVRPGDRPPPAAVVLLSDGKSVRGVSPIAAAREAARAKVPVYTVALGTPQGTIESRGRNGRTRLEPVPPDPETLERIAAITDGRAYAATDAARLDEVFERLGSQVAVEERPREITAAFAGGALLLLVVAAAMSLRWFGRLL